MVLEKTLENPLDSKEIKTVNPKGNQAWIFIGRTDAEAVVLWPPDAKSRLLEKTPVLGRIEGRRRRGDRIRWLNGVVDSIGRSLSKLGNSEGQGRLACCSAWSCKESDTPEWLNNNNMLFYLLQYKRGKMRVSKYFRDWRVSGMQVLAFATVTFCYKVLAVIFSWQAFFSFHHSEVSVCSLHLYF